MATTTRIRSLADAEQLDEQETFVPVRKRREGNLTDKQRERLDRSRRSTPRQEALGRRGSGRYREAMQA